MFWNPHLNRFENLWRSWQAKTSNFTRRMKEKKITPQQFARPVDSMPSAAPLFLSWNVILLNNYSILYTGQILTFFIISFQLVFFFIKSATKAFLNKTNWISIKFYIPVRVRSMLLWILAFFRNKPICIVQFKNVFW